MITVQVKSETEIRAIQLKKNNMFSVQKELIEVLDKSTIRSINTKHIQYDHLHGMGHVPVKDTRMTPDSMGFEIGFLNGTYLAVQLMDWVVFYKNKNNVCVSVCNDFEFHNLFDSQPSENATNNNFNMSLLEDKNIQRLFDNPNDYRLFMHIINVYTQQIETKGYKNAIQLDTRTVMSICQMSDKTFRKSRNKLIEMGIIYQGIGGYKISFESLNSWIKMVD